MTIRTLHLINGLGTGGAERSLAELVPELHDRGIEPAVAVLHRRDEGVEEQVAASGVAVHHLDAAGWRTQVAAFRSLVRRLDPDVVHTSIFEADVIGRLAAGRLRPRVLTSLVNTTYAESRFADPNIRRSRLRLTQVVDGVTAHLLGDHFHAVTQDVKDSAVAALRLSPDDITVVPRGRRRDRLGEPGPDRRRAVRRRLGFGDGDVLALHVGRQEFQKGHAVLLDAMAPLLDPASPKARPDLHLLLAGRKGNASADVAARLTVMASSRVHELGHRDDIPDLLAAVDVFVFPSHFEGIGGAAIEAMALEVPIVASDLGGLREVLDGVAAFAPPGDPSALRAALADVLDRPEEARHRASIGRERFDSRYEHHRMVDGMADLFERVATRR